MAEQNIKKIYRNRVGMEDLSLGTGTETQTRNGQAVTITKVNASLFLYDDTRTLDDVYNVITEAETNANNSASGSATSASQASTSATSAEGQAVIATTQAVIATTQADIATTKAFEANDSAISASTSASNASNSAAESAASAATIDSSNIIHKDGSGLPNEISNVIGGIAWTSNNDGSGSGLDADTVDGKHASELGPTGGGNDKIFSLNDQVVTTSYTIPTGQNAMTAGDITINTGVTVTVPTGSRWVVV